VRHDGGVGDGGGESQAASGGQDRVALLAGAELGVEIARAAQAEDALEEAGVAGEEDEAVTVVRQAGGQELGATCQRVTLSEAKGA
jgi:hypothetical protein